MKLRTVMRSICGIFVAILVVCLTPNLVRVAHGKVIELKFAHHVPPVAPISKVFEAWAKKVEEQSGGRVKITIYPSQTLVKGPDFYTGTAGGLCDLYFGVNIMDHSRFPLNTIMDVPLMPWPDHRVASRIYTDLSEKFPEMRNEFKDVKVLWRFASIPRTLHLKEKEVRLPQDMKGLKVIAFGPLVRAVKTFGASPVVLFPPDWYMSLERGVAEGLISSINVVHEYKVLPLVKTHTDLYFSLVGMEVIMNLKKWRSLPPDIQKVINDLNPWALDETLKAFENSIEAGKKAARQMGHKIIVPTPDDKKLWYQAIKPVQQGWVANGEAKGLPAQEVFDTAQELIIEYSK